MEHPGEPLHLTVGGGWRHEVLDLDVDAVADLQRVAAAVVGVVDLCHLHAEHLPEQGAEHRHRSADLPAEDGTEPVSLLR